MVDAYIGSLERVWADPTLSAYPRKLRSVPTDAP
jgi:hypothetical protein